jgi:hypothetical protein
MGKGKRIEELQTLIHVQNVLMESMTRKRGEYILELSKLIGRSEILVEAN